jgi:predicted phage tail protein
MLREIVLAGELGVMFGRKHMLAVESPAEAIRALSANFRAFKTYLIEAEKKGLGFRVVVAKRDQVLETLGIRHRRAVRFTIVPTLLGAKKGGFVQILIGVALVAASFAIPGGWAIGSIGIASMVGSLGVSLILGGLAATFFAANKAPVPKSEQADSRPSYAFAGPVNTVAQGYPVPIGYGEFIVGSATISAGQTAEEYPLSAP